MAIKITPHLAVAGGIVLVALAITVGPLVTGPGDFPITTTDPKVATPAAPIYPATAALDPLVDGVDRMPTDNPFTLRKTGKTHGLRISVPPPPPLDLPLPPILPLPMLPIAGVAP